jgi:hypothetical protein
MLWVGFEPTKPVFERAKTFDALDRVATVIGPLLAGNDYTHKSVLYVIPKTKLHGLSPQANYTDRLSDRRLSAKLVPTLAARGCHVVSATVPPQSLISVF